MAFRVSTILPSIASRNQLTCSVPSRTMATQGIQNSIIWKPILPWPPCVWQFVYNFWQSEKYLRKALTYWYAGDQDLAKFLKDEIATEKQNSRSLPKLSGWEVKTDGSEVCDSPSNQPQIFKFSCHLWLLGDTDKEIWIRGGDDHIKCESHSGQRRPGWWHRRSKLTPLVQIFIFQYCVFQAPEMLSKPTFEVDLIKPGGKTLSFTCSYVQEDEHPEGQEPDEEGK